MVQFNLDVPKPTLIDTDSKAKQLLRLGLRKIKEDPEDFIGIDTETNGFKIPLKSGDPEDVKKNDPLDWMRDTVTFWSLSWKMGRKYHRYCLLGQHLHIFIPLIENPKANLVSWNMGYDAHVCWNSGVNLWCANSMDGVAMGHLANENMQGRMGLKDVCKRQRGFVGNDLEKFVDSGDIEAWKSIPMRKFKDLFGTEDEFGNKIEEYKTSLFNLPIDLVSDYASLDAYAHLKIVEHLCEVLQVIPISDDYSMWNHYIDMEKDITEILWRMERRGLGLDKRYLKKRITPMAEELEKISREINKIAGRPINVESTPQLQALFFGPKDEGGLGLEPIKMTDSGKAPSTDADVLDKLAAEGVKLAQKVKRYRKVRIIKNTFAGALVFLSEWHEDGRVHPSINQFGARTGRFSMTAPNGQNMPRPDTDEFRIRQAFVPKKKNKILIVADYGQLEMRIMAHFSKDKGMLRAIRDGMDLHCFAVEKMYGIPYAEVKAAKKKTDTVDWDDLTPREQECLLKRQICKNTGFAIIYGAGAQRVSVMLEIPKADAKAIVDLYFQAFPGVKQFMDKTIQECRFDEFVTTIMGRRRRLPEINNSQFQKWSAAEREAVNARIQGSAADITKAAMINIEFDKQLNLWGVNLLNQIHDELVMDVFKQYAELALPLVKNHMEKPFNGGDALCIPTPVDIKIVENWAQAK